LILRWTQGDNIVAIKNNWRQTVKSHYPQALRGGALLLALLQAQGAWAQTAAVPPAPSPDDAAHLPAQADAPATVIVTANKREQRLQDVPMSVSVVNAAQLQQQNISEVMDLVRGTPGLNSAGPFGALSIRGIGSISFARSAEGSVGVVVDNVALAGTSINPPQLFDVSRVEVLEGPQGTLFGSNASAGIINIVTNAPNPAKFEAIGHVDVGTRGDHLERVTLNVPLAPNAAVRASASYDQAPKELHNLYDDSWQRNQNEAARVRLLWEPFHDVSVNLIADYTQVSHNGGVPWAVYKSTPGSALSQNLAACGVQVGADNDSGCVNGGNASTQRAYGYSGQVDFKLGQYAISAISAYRQVDTNIPSHDVDSSPLYLLNQAEPGSTHFFSQELRLSSPKNAHGSYVAGLYYFDSRLANSVTQVGPYLRYQGVPYLLGQTLSTAASTINYAAFADGTLFVTPSLGLNLGVRYGTVDVHARTTGKLAPGAVAALANISGVEGDAHDHYASFRAGAQYDLSDNNMLYGSYTRGYKGPAINDQGGGIGLPVLVQPEIPHATELGLKNTLMGGRLLANVALFHTRVDNFQAQFYAPAISAFVFGNAPSLTTQGVELSLQGRPLRNLTVNLGATYTSAKYGNGYIVTCPQSLLGSGACKVQLNGAGKAIGATVDAGGNRLVGSPETKLTLGGEYRLPALGRYAPYVQADIVATSRIYCDPAYDPVNSIAPAAIVGARIGARSSDGRLGFSFFVRNLFDTYRAAARLPTPTAGQQLDPLSYAQIPGPESARLIGVSLDARF
jgi:iron complex outermembrane receptor protein